MLKHIKNLFIPLICFVLVFTYLVPVAQAANLRDVQPSNSKYTEIHWAVDNGLIAPLSHANFAPQTSITEAELIAAIAQLDENYHLGSDINTIYHFYSSLNIPLKGTYDVNQRKQSITRGDFARIYSAFVGLDLSEVYAVQYLYSTGVTNGTSGKKTYKDYQPERALTRADAAVFLYRIAQLGRFAVEGLQTSPTGKDNGKITLPENFITSGQTVEFENPSNQYNDPSGANDIQPVKNIHVEKGELIANGIDSTLITLDLLDCYGGAIQNNESLQFRVKSKAGAAISTSSNKASYIVKSDGGKVTVKVIAPKSTKSIRDTITFELVNSKDKKFACYNKKQIEVDLRYIPKAELRVTYEVYDPDSSETKEIPKPVQPIVLPEGYAPGDVIKASKIDAQRQQFHVVGSERKVHYGYAELRYAGQSISIQLFEYLVQYFDGIGVYYSLNDEGRPIFDIPLVPMNKDEEEKDAKLGAKEKALVQLIRILESDTKGKITLSDYDSVKSIYALYSSLSNTSKALLNQEYKAQMTFIEKANETVEKLLEEKRQNEAPKGMEGYTKIIVSLVAPGGEVIPDYQGTVDITFDGRRVHAVPFKTNTKDYINNTGHPGAAVAYFDHIKYGEAEVTVKLNAVDSVYEPILTDIHNKVIRTTIYTKQKFVSSEDIEREEEIAVAYILDQSISILNKEKYEFIAEETRELIKELQAEHNITMTFNTSGVVEKTGSVEQLGNLDNLFIVKEQGQATHIAQGLNVAFNQFKKDDKLKYIILVSDGNTTERQMRQMIDRAKNEGVKVFTISVGETAQINYPLMASLAKESGGEYFQAETKAQIHEAYQSIYELIQYGQFKTDPKDKTVLTDAKVMIHRNTVTMTAHANDKQDVGKVIARFSSVYGELEVELIHRGANVYSISRPVSMFQDFSVFEEVEFLVYDKNNNYLGSKTVNVSQ